MLNYLQLHVDVMSKDAEEEEGLYLYLWLDLILHTTSLSGMFLVSMFLVYMVVRLSYHDVQTR